MATLGASLDEEYEQTGLHSKIQQLYCSCSVMHMQIIQLDCPVKIYADSQSSSSSQLSCEMVADRLYLHSNPSFYSVYCSPATKDILLRSATASERVHAEINGVKSDDYYTFRNLQEPVYNAKGKAVIREGKKVRVDVLVSFYSTYHITID